MPRVFPRGLLLSAGLLLVSGAAVVRHEVHDPLEGRELTDHREVLAVEKDGPQVESGAVRRDELRCDLVAFAGLSFFDGVAEPGLFQSSDIPEEVFEVEDVEVDRVVGRVTLPQTDGVRDLSGELFSIDRRANDGRC